MVESANNKQEELPDYELVYDFIDDKEDANGAANDKQGAQAKPSDYVGVHATSFKDMLLKPELQ